MSISNSTQSLTSSIISHELLHTPPHRSTYTQNHKFNSTLTPAIMHYTTLLLPLITATFSFAAAAQDTTVQVILADSGAELGSQTRFMEDFRQTKRPTGSTGPFKTVALRLGEGVKNKALRCKILDSRNNPIVVTRGENVDTTFADGGEAKEWVLRDGEQKVKTIICDPAFVKAAAPVVKQGEALDLDIRVTLSDGNLATQTAFHDAGLERERQKPVGSSGPYNSVTLAVGKDVANQALRCQIMDLEGEVIELARGENEDVTFADGGKGAWTFLEPASSEVGKIVCDPGFAAA
ncbi:hypothetical protein B0A48_13406 [Cryoendolithus antarcticus]|uniref:Uncharacterized protein n=1 Tax=Cryoendolithus antarcticus TaxID=1507870 RepID=A0A1V8SPU6_9PEZI|nr:hypothetical protein B0A48_13406 [Cryoendolithus antarcticus]